MAVSGTLDLYSKLTWLVFQEELVSFSACKNFESYKIQVTIYAYNVTVTEQLQAECFHMNICTDILYKEPTRCNFGSIVY
jgi:hypothetical protein